MNHQEIIAKFQSIIERTSKEELEPGNYPRKALCGKDARGKRIINYPKTYEAFAKRQRDFKYLLGLAKGDSLDDLATITAKRGGTVRLALHLYLHHCLPEYPEKAANLLKHRTNAGSNVVMNNILREVEAWLDQARVTDEEYAQRLLENKRLVAFAEEWNEAARLYV